MNSKQIIPADVTRILAGLGFAEDRVQQAVATLFAPPTGAPTAPPIEHVLSFKQTCEILSLSKSGLRRIVDTGALKPIVLTKRRIGFRQRDIIEFINSRPYALNIDLKKGSQ